MPLPRRVEEASKEKVIEVSQKVILDTLNDIKVELKALDDYMDKVSYNGELPSMRVFEKRVSLIEELISNHEHIDLEYMIDGELRLEGTGFKIWVKISANT